MSDFFSLKDLILENQNQVILSNTNEFYVEAVTELNKILQDKAAGIRLDSSENMVISYESGHFTWNLSIFDGDQEVSFVIFYSQNGKGTGITMTANSVYLRTPMAIAINNVLNFYNYLLLPKIQQNMPSKSF